MSTSIVVVGAGHLGNYHLTKIAAHPDATLHAIVEIDSTKHEELSTLHNVPVYTDLKDVAQGAQAAIIATPTQNHLQSASAALAQGLHVLVEKPICSTASQGQELCAQAKDAGKLLLVGHSERFNPAVMAALKVADQTRYFVSERLAPFTGRSTDVDVVLDLMIHDLDILASLVDAPLKEVRAIGMPVITNSVDMAAVRLEFEDGTVAQCSAGRASLEPSRKIRLFTRERYISIDCAAQEVKSVRRLPSNDDNWPEISGENIEISKDDALYLQLDNFLKAINDNQSPIVDGQAGVRALSMAEAIKEAIANHKFA